MKRVHYSVQRVSHAMRRTGLRNGGSERCPERAVVKMLKAAGCHAVICTLPGDAVDLVLESIDSSGHTSIKEGMIYALPLWVSDAIAARDLGEWRWRRTRIERLTSAMAMGAIHDQARHAKDVQTLRRLLTPMEPYIECMAEEEFRRLVKFRTTGPGATLAELRARHLPDDIRILTDGRVVVPSGPCVA